MTSKPIDRLLFAQGNLCFFCNMPLLKAHATVEHLVPTSRAGSNSDDNCVACCKAMNTLLGSMSLKEKIRVVLNQNGQFTCPNGKIATPPVPPSPENGAPSPPTTEHDYLVLAALLKQGKSRPSKVKLLKNAIRVMVSNAKGSITESQLETLIKQLQANGKIIIDGTKVSYSLGAAENLPAKAH
jgi:hypothetical protein